MCNQIFRLKKKAINLKILFVFFWGLNTLFVSAQPEKANVVPPSIENYNFTKYGGLEMNNNNGGFSYSVPLYNLKYHGINLPISLSYYTDGVKVNDIAGIAGMNWNLMAGGMITRVVKDQPDEYAATIKFRPETSYINKIIEGNYDDAYYLANIKEDAMKLWNAIYNTEGAHYYNKQDTEQDAFSFNFNGHSGNFYIENNQIYLDTDEAGIKASFEKVIDGAYSYLKFTFITPDGIKYTLGGAAEFVEDSEISGDCARNYSSPIPTTWHLKEIDYNNQTVRFSYKTIFKHYPFDYSQSVSYKLQESGPECPIPGTISDCLTSFGTSNGKVLTQIEFGTSKVKFNYLTQRDDYYAGYLLSEIVVHNGFADIEKFNFEYTYSINNSQYVPNINTLQNKKRAFLQKLIFKNNSTQQFEYNNINEISPRLSYSQDLYGYSNANTVKSLLNVNFDGQPNNSLKTFMKAKFPGLIDQANRSTDQSKSLFGVLNKITYPTKGYSLIDYENNLNLEILNVKKAIIESVEVRKSFCQPNTDDLETYTLTFTGNGTFISILADALADSCNNNDIDVVHDRHSLSIKNLTTGQLLYSRVNDTNEPFVSNESVVFDNGSTFYPIKTVSGQQYMISYGVQTKFDDVRGSISIEYNSYYAQEPTVVNYSGARVKEIKDYDSNGDIYNKTNYVYNKVTDLNSGRTSLHHNYFFSPWIQDCVAVECFVVGNSVFTSTDCKNTINFGSSNYLAGLASRGNRINYQTVSAILTNKNVIENKYYVNDGTEDQPVLVHRKYLDNTTRSNPLGWHDGKLEETTIYNFQGGTYVPAKSTKTKYEVLNDVSFYNYNIATGLKTSTQFSAMDINHVYNNNEENGDNPQKCNTLICNIREKLKIEKYFNHCTVRARTETIETEYLKGKAITNTTKYLYSAANNYLLSSQTSTNSKGEILESKFYYASSPEMASQPFRSQLIAGNMLQPPLQTQTFSGATKIAEQLTIYDNSAATGNLLLPKFIYSAKFPNAFAAVTGVGNLEKKITYDKYDDRGNLLQYTTESGMPVSIIWGYHKTQPIAKIENAAYSTIEPSVLNLQNLSNADNDTCLPAANCKEELLRKALNNLRTAFPQFMISTYTYNPLIGVTSITDPKAEPAYYQYDASNRLQHIIDKDLNVLQKYCYNYKGQVIDCTILANGVVYSSSAKSGSFTRNNCPAGMIASSVSYSQAAGAVTSTISQADADAKGLAKFNLEGQAYANSNGTCTGVVFNAVGVQDILLKKMFVTLTASSSNHTGHTFTIEIVYDTATNPANYKTVTLALLNGETSKTFTVAVPALSNAEIVSF